MENKNCSANKWLVSIIVTSYNYGRYLDEALRSALNQTYLNIEIIVVDDGSTDNTKSIAEFYPVKYVFQKHQGISAARNTGIQLSHGDFFMSLDGDDKLHPRYVEETLNQILKKPSTGFVYTGSLIWNEIDEIENIWMPRRLFSKYSLFAGWWGALGPIMIRKTAFESLDHGYDLGFTSNEDLDLCFRLLSAGWKFDLVAQPLHWYRVHSGSLNPSTPQRRKMAEAYMDRRFWFRRPYRKIYNVYQGTIGRLTSFMRNPIEYLKSVQFKIQINSQTASFYGSIESREKAQRIQREIISTIDRMLEWNGNTMLQKYYSERIRILESKLNNLANTSKKNYN